MYPTPALLRPILSIAIVFTCLGSLTACGRPRAAVAPQPAIADQRSVNGAAATDALIARVDSIADEYYDSRRAAFPEINTIIGDAKSRHDRLKENTASAERAWWDKEDRWIAALRRIDAAPLIGRPAWVTHRQLSQELETSIGMRVCQERLWNVHPLYGFLAFYARIADLQPVGSESLRNQALTRWRDFPRIVDAEIANLREGVRRGYTEPQVNVERVIGQADQLSRTPTEASPFYKPAARDSTPAFRQAYATLVTDAIRPAVARYHDYLKDEYLAAARVTVAITGNPDGQACNRASIRRYTTLDLAPEEIHRIGLELVAAAESTMRAVVLRHESTGDVRGAMQRLRLDSTTSFRSRDEVIPTIEVMLARVTPAVNAQFGVLPKAALSVRPYPAFQESSVPFGEYMPAAEDGSRAGVFQVNLGYALRPGERADIEGLTFHEGIPGHHLQMSIARERSGAGVHPLTRFLFTSAFAEGWAVYATRMAEKLGLFSSDAARLMFLESDVYGGATLVLETGLHAMGWTRQQAIGYEVAHTSRTAAQAAIDVDRRIGRPGQGFSYFIGAREIGRLRAEAERALGPKFDVRAFHDHVLENGAVTLPMLREQIARWIAERRAAP